MLRIDFKQRLCPKLAKSMQKRRQSLSEDTEEVCVQSAHFLDRSLNYVHKLFPEQVKNVGHTLHLLASVQLN